MVRRKGARAAAECNGGIPDSRIPYDESVHGKVKGTIPLMAVIQPKKDKVRPVMDFRELNTHLGPHTADADVCSEKIREWRRCGKMCLS